MKFREHKNVFVKCVACNSVTNLEWVIEKAGQQYDLIDLQYSTTTVSSGNNMHVEYSALMLLAEKGENNGQQ